MSRKPYTSYNRYFLFPFLLWIVAGGIAILSSDKETLFKFFNTHHSAWLDIVMMGVTTLGEGWFITVVLLLLLGVSAYRNWWYFITASLAMILPSIATQALKSAFGAARPLKYFNGANWIHTMPDWPHLTDRSFPSGHSCGAFSLFCLLSLLLPPKYKYLGFFCLLLALAVAYSRMYIAVHFFEDVYVGSIIGTLMTLIVVYMMNRFQHIFIKS